MPSISLNKYSNYLIKKVMESASNGIFALDLQGSFILVNEAGASIAGRTVEELLGMSFRDLLPKEDLPAVEVLFNKTAFYGDSIREFKTRLLRPSGEIRHISFSISPLRDNGKIIGVVGTAEDVTERLRQERALEAYSQTLHTILDGLDAVIYVADINTYEIIFVNRKLQDFIGRDDLVGKLCYQVLQKGQTGPCPFCTNKYLLDEYGRPRPESYSWEFQNTVTGRWLSLKDRAMYWPDGRLVRLEVAIDITDAKDIQEEVLKRERRLQSIINTTAEGYWEVDNLNRIVEVNDALCRMLGYSKEELIGASMYNFVDEENARVFKEQESLRAIKTHRSFNITLISKEGKEVHTRVQATTLRDDEGNITGAFGFITDITELLQIEGSVAKYTAALERSNRELQDFAYIASHDLQEPLRKIVAFGDRLSQHAESLDAQGKDYLQRMQRAALRMQQFIEDLLQYSRVMTRPQPFEAIDLKVPIQKAVLDLQECFVAEDCHIVMDEIPVIEADPVQMVVLFKNLISNSIKFRRPEESPFIWVSYDYPDDHSVLIKVQDNGIGFDERYKDRLFKPFSRLHGKSEYPGTGMGLAICDKIVKRHGGKIDAKSEIGKGTTFLITLPIRQTVALPEAARKEASTPAFIVS